jgi:hypothetical protein
MLHGFDVVVGAADQGDRALIQVGGEPGCACKELEYVPDAAKVLGRWREEDDQVVGVDRCTVFDHVPR